MQDFSNVLLGLYHSHFDVFSISFGITVLFYFKQLATVSGMEVLEEVDTNVYIESKDRRSYLAS